MANRYSMTDSPLVALVKAFEQVQRIETYLVNTSYWAHWYDDFASAMELLRESEQALRAEIAKRATLN